MRVLPGLVRVGLLLAVSLASVSLVSAEPAQPAPAAQTLTFGGDIALWTVAIKPDKTSDFEAIMGRLRDALLKSNDPNRRKQAEGWKVMKLDKPMPDGNVVYVHVISPVVPGADYTVMQALYDAFPEERQALYDMYRGAFAQNLSLASGSVVLDMSKAPQNTSR